jgi:urease accessory protein
MLRAMRIVKHWTGATVDEVRLEHDQRRRRRVVLETAKGLSFLLDLPDTPDLEEGDGICLPEGGVVRVTAASEDLLEIRCADRQRFARIAWHLGNRHLPLQVCESSLRVRMDRVIAEMVQSLGADIRRLRAPFRPEQGAYAHKLEPHYG